MNWKETEKGLQTTLKFENQTELASFVLKLAELSDKIQHHADMDIRYNQLHLNIFTHDKDAVTEKDYALSKEIERLF